MRDPVAGDAVVRGMPTRPAPSPRPPEPASAIRRGGEDPPALRAALSLVHASPAPMAVLTGERLIPNAAFADLAGLDPARTEEGGQPVPRRPHSGSW